MNLKKSTRIALEMSVDKLLNSKNYDNALKIIIRYKLKNYTMTKGRAKFQYKLKDSDLRVLSCLAVDNPHYKCAPKMKLYLKKELEDKFNKAAIRKKKINELLID